MEAAGSDTRSTLTSAAIIRTSYAMAKACESDFTPWDPGKSASGTSPTKARYRSSEHRRAAAHTRRALFVCQRSGVLLLLPPSAPFPNNVSCCQQLKDWIQVSGQLLRRSASFRMPLFQRNRQCYSRFWDAFATILPCHLGEQHMLLRP